MVDIRNKLTDIKKLIDQKSYFTINRGWQYGKTTTLIHLHEFLRNDYTVLSLTFEGLGDESFRDTAAFCQKFLELISRALRLTDVSSDDRKKWLDKSIVDFDSLSEHITKLSESKKFVLLIDEVDKISNNRVFLQFLSMLRKKFLERKARRDFTFHSVILAGVYDVKNIKLKMHEDGIATSSKEIGALYNSPWNIAVDFKVRMSFNPVEIASMLVDYEKDHQTGMNVREISESIYYWTGGYPFLVSKLCKSIDENLGKLWDTHHIQQAVNDLLREKNTLFENVTKNLKNHPEVYHLLYDVLIVGARRTFNIYETAIELSHRYGIIRDENGFVKIANPIFETLITNYFISQDEKTFKRSGVLYEDIVRKGKFDMASCLEKFAKHYREIYNDRDEQFLEREERLLFLTYLKPLLNGRGFYHIESGLTDERRMDVVVDFGNEQFIVELKRWDGISKHEKAYLQLVGYMEKKEAMEGYLLTFGGSKGMKSQHQSRWINQADGKKIFDVIV